ncbi:MAG: hypothetical protein H8E49_13280 [Gammaproteobacteria bacterium]|nr:hypothetical protein [Gammaproteobacteria bacterium]
MSLRSANPLIATTDDAVGVNLDSNQTTSKSADYGDFTGGDQLTVKYRLFSSRMK